MRTVNTVIRAFEISAQICLKPTRRYIYICIYAYVWERRRQREREIARERDNLSLIKKKINFLV